MMISKRKFYARRRRRCLLAALAAALVLLLAAGAARSAEADAFPDITVIDAKLTRGDSTKADVVLAFGQPQGTGGAFIPTDKSAKEIWYYENVKIEMLAMKARQQVLLIFFRGEIYDGYFWFGNSQKLELK